MSVLLPPATVGETVNVSVRFAEYVPEAREDPDGGRGKTTTVWRRFARTPAALVLPLDPHTITDGRMVDGAPGIWVKGSLAPAEAPALPAGSRALALFVVNQRTEEERPGARDAQFVFQVEMEVAFAAGFCARPNGQGETSDEWDDKVADLQYRNHAEHAVGHGVSVEVLEQNAEGRATRVRTCWLPRHEVARVRTHEDDRVPTSMEKLAALETGAAVRDALTPLVDLYGEWLRGQRGTPVDSADRERTRDDLLRRAERARARIRAGLDRIASDPEVFLAFRLANEAMARCPRSAVARTATTRRGGPSGACSSSRSCCSTSSGSPTSRTRTSATWSS